jgi:Cu/Ag efflux protein CusF
MSRRAQIVLGLVVVALMLGVMVAPALAADTKGRIKEINTDKKEFVLADTNGKNWTIHTDRDCKFYLNDKEAAFSDLKTDDQVEVVYEKQGDRLMASSVKITRK